MCRKTHNFLSLMSKRRYRKPAKTDGQPALVLTAPMRLNRYLAQSGLCSRRQADGIITEGRVQVNGEVAKALGIRVQPGDEVIVDGKMLTPRPYEYILLNKPGDTITTTKDHKGRRTVMDLVQDESAQAAGVFPVGRLDRHTVGALLLTNDGDLAHRLMHPSYTITKLYLVRTEDPVKPHELEKLKAGVSLEDGPARADDVTYLSNTQEIGLSIHEGRNRQVRRMIKAIGHQVKHLERVNYAGLTLKGIRRGKWRRLRPNEVHRLRRLAGLP